MSEVTGGKEAVWHRLLEFLHLMPVHYVYDSNAKAGRRASLGERGILGIYGVAKYWQCQGQSIPGMFYDSTSALLS